LKQNNRGCQISKPIAHDTKIKPPQSGAALLVYILKCSGMLLGSPFQSFQYGEDKGCRQKTGDYKDSPQLPELNFFPEEASDEKEFVSYGGGQQPATLHHTLEPYGSYLGYKGKPHGTQE